MPTAEQLSDTTALLFGVERADLFSKSRTQRITQARHALAWALRRSDWSLEEIGAYLHRDHTSIMHGLKQVERRARRDIRFADRLKCLCAAEDTAEHVARLAERLDGLIVPSVDWWALAQKQARELECLRARVEELEARP